MKVVELLKTLSENELIRFEKFINSPYHNETKEIIALYEALINSDMNGGFNKSEYLTNYKWSDAKFRKQCNEIITLLIDFITIEYRVSNKLIDDLAKYEAIISKNWIDYFRNKKNVINNHKIDKNSWTEIELARLYIILKKQIDSNLLNPSDSLAVYAEIAQTRKEFMRQSELSTFIDLENFRHNNYFLTREILRSITPLNNIQFRLFRDVKKLLEGKQDNEHILKIKDHLLASNLDKDYSDKILTQCIGYLSTLINQGHLEVTSKIFDLYKFGIENDLLKIYVGMYRNIAYLACREGEFDWALKFVENYKSKLLDETDQQTAYSFTKARTLWYAKDWEGVIRTLRNVEYKDMTYNLLARSYILTCYYELDDYEPLDSLIKSFKVYLRRKRNVSKARKDSFYNFITALDHLMKASERSDYKRIIKAHEVIADNPSTRNKDWLNEKIEELEAIIPQPKSKSKAKA